MAIFFWFSLAQSTWDDAIVEKLFTQFTNWTVQTRINCKNLNAAMTSLWNWVRLKLTNDTNNTRLKNIKASFIERARTYMNEKLNCSAQWNIINTLSTKTSNKKVPTKIKSLSLTGNSSGLYVDLKVNDSDTPTIVNWYSTLNITWTSIWATSCFAYWNYIKLQNPTTTKKYWNDLNPLPTQAIWNSSIKLLAATKHGLMYTLPVSIQCLNYQWNSVADTVNVPVRPILYWDVDLNGYVNAWDSLVVTQHVNNSVPLTTWTKKCSADVDLNGKINTLDATLIGQYSVGIINNFPNGSEDPWHWDTNQDGIVNSADAQIILTCLWNISIKWFQAGNVNWDNKLDYKDACIIANYFANHSNGVTSLPYGWPLPSSCNPTNNNSVPSACTKMKTAECQSSDSYNIWWFNIIWSGS